MFTRLRKFQLQSLTASPSLGAIALVLAAIIAIVFSNSSFSPAYNAFVSFRGELRLGPDWVLAKPLNVWVNDLWMAVFFFLVGLELKRELLEGSLATRSQLRLPVAAALGGMACPALIYVAFNGSDAVGVRGWAIPAATDIAFALGVLALLGRRVPASLKVFLLAVAIIDDLGAIAIIAVFYSADLYPAMLALAALGCTLLGVINRCGVTVLWPYFVTGVCVWLFVLQSGVHPTIAGVLTALAVPLRDAHGQSPLRVAEHALQPWVTFLVLPTFALVNAGVVLDGIGIDTFTQNVSLGITLGLLVGKACGVFGASCLMIRCGLAELPAEATWRQFFGVCVLCGIGFTMSLFIGSLAFSGEALEFERQLKLGVLAGSLLSALAGSLILYRQRPA